MSQSSPSTESLPGVSPAVVVAGICFAIGAGATGAALRLPQHPPTGLLLTGWPLFALAGGVLLDQGRQPRLGAVMTAFGVVPLVVQALAILRVRDWPTSSEILEVAATTSALAAAALAIALPWALRPPRRTRTATGLAGLAVVGGLLVPAAPYAGWVLAVVGAAGVWLLIARDGRADDRSGRRRLAWLLMTLAAGAVATALTCWTASTQVACYATASVLVLIAVSVVRLCFVTGFRPLDEHALELAVGLAAIGAAVLVAVVVRVGAVLTRVPSPTTSAAFSALLTLAVAAPAALWVRRTALARRYGRGIISPADVALITADLHAQAEPRDLLDKAARMVAAASGSSAARIVLGEDLPDVPERWVLHPLLVGGDRVGALVVESVGTEGPELRQQQVIAQLLPTVALVARAVGLAVEAEHARQDVARERDAERRRILADLHDGLGPLLAGMSMRVRAELRRQRPAEDGGLLTDLAAGLADSRTDLRRLVAGITPSALDEGDLRSALERLVTSFQAAGGGPRVSLEFDLAASPSVDVQVAIYRCVAEGVTNALRHAGASRIDVRVAAGSGGVVVDVVDDGVGGQVVPGVGLSSLRQRADSLGGRLRVAPSEPAGTRMHLELPAGQVPA